MSAGRGRGGRGGGNGVGGNDGNAGGGAHMGPSRGRGFMRRPFQHGVAGPSRGGARGGFKNSVPFNNNIVVEYFLIVICAFIELFMLDLHHLVKWIISIFPNTLTIY